MYKSLGASKDIKKDMNIFQFKKKHHHIMLYSNTHGIICLYI